MLRLETPAQQKLQILSGANLDSDSTRLGGSGREGSSNEVSVQEKLRVLEKTVVTLQAQLAAPCSTAPKVMGFKAIVDLIKDTIPTEL